jgi:hypothetical protein
MAESDPSQRAGILPELLREEAQLIPRLRGVLRFDASVYRGIEADPNAIPPAFTVVLAASFLSGLGRTSLAGIFLGIALAVLFWGLCSALIWAVAAAVLGRVPDYARLVRCLGFAYAWNALSIFALLPWIGSLIEWAAALLWTASAVVATREALETTPNQVFLICALALAVPLVVFGLAA